MLTTTFAKIKAEPGSAEIYKQLAEALGGVSRYGQNTPITLDIIIESIGLADAIWAMRCANEPPFNLLLEFACRCAEHALPVFEAKYPEDKRVRSAITAARKYFVTPTSDYPKYEVDTTHSAHSATHAAYYAFAEHRKSAAFAAWTAHSLPILPPITPTGSSIKPTPLMSRRWLLMSLTLRIPTGRLMILN